MNQKDKVLSYIGLGMRGRNVVTGEFTVEKTVKSHKAHLVIIAEDASNNTKKMFQNMCEFYKVPIYYYGTKESLGNCVGQMKRASIAVTNQGIAESIEKLVINKDLNSEVKNGKN